MKLAVNPGDPTNFNIAELCFEDAAEDFGMQAFKMKDRHPQPQAPPGQSYEPMRFDMYVEAGLRAPIEHLALVNPFASQEVQDRIRAAQDLTEFEDIPFASLYDCPDELPEDRKAAEFRKAATFIDQEEGAQPRPAAALRASPERPWPLLPCCFLTGASAFAAHALDPQPGEAVLDLCAGPGTKALLLASMLFAQQIGGQADPNPNILEQVGVEAGQLDGASVPMRGRLILNEPNKVRSTLLEGMLSSFLPAEMLAKGGPVALTKAEVSEKVPIALQRLGPFDKILVDPPCSDARAQAVGGKNNRMEAERDSSKLKRNAELIEMLLRCAGALLKPGGVIVYCTTSLQERENDDAVRRFIRRMNGEFETEQGVKDQPIQGSTCTAHGTMVLPNQMAQHGPLYYSRLRHAVK
mmetsp:Transcript_21103/g.57683  ORF Transcript_21103/g.57683 Transcript_21103/m.57683 type:complete len:410 (-) Transcript_21103:173-1402(-)